MWCSCFPLAVYFTFFFLLASLAKGLLVFFIFSKNQLLVSLIFFFYQSAFHLISTLIFMISFLLLTLGFICSVFLRYKVRLFEIFLVSWGSHLLLWAFLLELALLHPIHLDMLHFHFHLSKGIFDFSIDFFFDILFSSTLFDLHIFWLFQFSPCNWFLVLYHCGWEKCLIWFQSS